MALDKEEVAVCAAVAVKTIMEVMIRPPWQQRAPAGEQDVTQLAAHSISDGNQSSALHRGPCEDFCEEGVAAVARSLSQFWQAGDAIGSVRTTAGLPISMTEFSNRRAVTKLFPR